MRRRISSEIKILITILLISIVISASFWNEINFWYIVTPVVLLGLIGALKQQIQTRYNKSFGIPAFIITLCIVLAGQYFFAKYLPVTSDTVENQKKRADLESFKYNPESIDAKLEFTKFQKINDSLTKIEVERLLKEGKVDEAVSCIEGNNQKTQKIKNFLFRNESSKSKEEDPQSHSISYQTSQPNRTFSKTGTKETLYFEKTGDVKKTSIIYLCPGQRIRVYSSTDCKIYNSKIDVIPNTWESYTQTVEGLVSVEGVGKKGKVVIEVM